MARVLVGTAPQVVAQCPSDVHPAFAWLQAHYDALRGQWVAVRLHDLELVAQASTLTQLWQRAVPSVLQGCLIHYVSTVANDHQTFEMEWAA